MSLSCNGFLSAPPNHSQASWGGCRPRRGISPQVTGIVPRVEGLEPGFEGFGPVQIWSFHDLFVQSTNFWREEKATLTLSS